MSIKKFPLEAYGAAVSREELVQAALDEITQNYREASLSNVARSYGVSLAYVSECVRTQTGRTYKELLQKQAELSLIYHKGAVGSVYDIGNFVLDFMLAVHPELITNKEDTDAE